MRPRIGSLCSGYGGLDLAVEAVIGGSVAWHVEYNPDASRILAHHYPDVPNHGDLTSTDWASVEPVEVLTAGYPCQPFSHAGKRKGASDERHLWPFVADTVRALRPRLVFLENVAGHVSLGLDAVVGDLSALGYVVRWGCLRAAAVGAPHGRERVFIVAADTDGSSSVGPLPGWLWPAGSPASVDVHLLSESRPTPADADDLGHERPGSARGRGRGPANGRVAAADTRNARLHREADHARRGKSDADGRDRRGQSRGLGATRPCRQDCAVGWDWGSYTAAVHRWHHLFRCVPAPVQPAARGGRPHLSPPFVEWMQGLPAGHVTDPAIWVGMRPTTARNVMLTALGNGVVPPQAEAAYRMLLPDLLGREVAA